MGLLTKSSLKSNLRAFKNSEMFGGIAIIFRSQNVSQKPQNPKSATLTACIIQMIGFKVTV